MKKTVINLDQEDNRLINLDVLRGLAILGVVLFHAYHRWDDFVPYDKNETLSYVVMYGGLGVDLFFLISGYLILRSMSFSKSLLSFMGKRWLRLFPSMLLISLIIFWSSRFMLGRPEANLQIIDLLPGLTLIEPRLLEKLANISTRAVDGSFWSLFVEVKFYIVSALSFFLLKDKKAVLVTLLWGALFLMESYGLVIDSKLILKWKNILEFDLSSKFFGLFSSGMFLYIYHTTMKKVYLYLSLFVYLVSAWVFSSVANNFVECFIVYICILFIFLKSDVICPFVPKKMKSFLCYFGFISYPLYLINQMFGLSVSIELYKVYSELNYIIYPIPGILLSIIIAHVSAAYWEPLFKNFVKKFVN